MVTGTKWTGRQVEIASGRRRLSGILHVPPGSGGVVAFAHGSGSCVFLCGDVMLERGIDQILPHPGSPVLHEPLVRDSRHYVQLAERVNGPILRLADFMYVWGDALEELQRAETDVRIVNL